MRNLLPKKILVLASSLVVIAGIFLAGCSSNEEANNDEAVLNVFNWSEYLPQSVIDKFEEEYGVKVNYSYYSSNEEMLAKLSVGSAGFDIAVASDYMVDIMRNQDLIQEINMDNITNYKNIGDDFKNLSFDPENKYTVPYMWGNAVIAVNTEKVKEPIKGYKDLWNSNYKNSLVVLDDQRAIIGITLKMLGYSMNEKDEQALEKAKQELKKLVPNIKAYDSDSPKTLLINGEAAIGYVWGAEAALAHKENPNIQVVLPEEGMYLWQDNFVIPKDAPHKKLAEDFINFILRPEISAEISKEFPYANPNVEAHKLIDPSILSDIAVYPPKEEIAKGEHLQDLGDVTKIYDQIWSEIKQ